MIDFEYLTNPEKYHTVPPRAEGEKDEQYKVRLGAYVQGIKSQQAKIDELRKDFNNFKLRAHNISVQRLDIEAFYDYEKNRADRLQARIDEALKMMDAESSNSWGLWKEKADMYEQGASDAYEKSYWILKGNKDEN